MAATLTGSLNTFTLADLLQWLEINRLSGRLTLRLGNARRTIDIKHGAIVYVSSSSPGEQLGAFLVGRGTLSKDLVYELLAENFTSGQSLTRLILDRGLLSREALAEVVEALAVKVLLDLFHWTGGTFEFDPLVATEDLLRIQLSLRGQVLAFQGAKSVDDTGGVRPLTKTDAEVEEPWQKEFRSEVLADRFWSLAEATADGAPTVLLRERFRLFHTFAAEIRQRLSDPRRFFPIFDDTSALIQAAFENADGAEHLVQIAALDPFLTVNLVHLANALPANGASGTSGASDRPSPCVATAREAAEVIGVTALCRLVALLSSESAPKVSSTDRLERAFRRTALSTAVAGSHLARELDLDAELAYTLGLVEPLGSYEPLKLLLAVNFEPGPFRASALDNFRALYGRVLARKLNVPDVMGEVLGSSGQVTSGSAPSLQLMFVARRFSPSGQIGREWTTDDPSLADRYADLARHPDLSTKIKDDTARVRELTGL